MANDQGSYSVPGLAQMLMQRNKDTTEAMKTIGTFAGATAAGIGGMVQGANDPQVFGDDTSGASGAAQAGLMNFGAAWNNGQGVTPTSVGGMARLMQNGGAPSSTAMNFKQFAAQGKLADATRDLMQQSTPTLPGQPEQPVMGMTDDQWKHAGTADKIQAFAAVKQANDLQQQQQGIQMGAAQMAHLAAQTQLYRAQAQKATGANNADQRLGAAVQTLTQPNTAAASMLADRASNPVQDPSVTAALGSLASPAPLTPMEYFATAIKSGVDPERAGNMAENLSRMAAVGKNTDFNFNPATDVQDIGGGLQMVKTSRGGGQVVQTPTSLAAAAVAKASAKNGTVRITDNSDLMNPRVIELPIDEAEKRGYIRAPGAGADTAGSPQTLPTINGKLDPTKMPAGTLYQTAYGPAVWDGKQFTRQK
jgi:hypothetical protein